MHTYRIYMLSRRTFCASPEEKVFILSYRNETLTKYKQK